jgi:hypothetical protein
MKKHLFVAAVMFFLMATVVNACGADIDIKPGSDQNKLNPTSGGRTKVAILTTSSFDATTVDPSTCYMLGPNTRSNGAPVENWNLQDIDSDGDMDMVLQFQTNLTGIEHGDESASVIGNTDEGESFSGNDDITTVGGGQ